MAGLFGNSPSDYYSGSNYAQQFGANIPQLDYQQFNPGSYGVGMGTNYANAVNQQLSGQLSPAQLQSLNQNFLGNLATTRQGAYGMPQGGEAAQTGQLAQSTALQATLLGQQQIAQGESAAMPYLNLGSQQNQYQNNFNVGQQNSQIQQNQYMGNLNANAYGQAANSQGALGGLFSAAANYGMGQLFPKQNAQAMPFGSDFMSPTQATDEFSGFGGNLLNNFGPK